jgi:hypothetical protein
MPVTIPTAFWSKPKLYDDILNFANGIDYELISSKKLYTAGDQAASFAVYSTDFESVNVSANNTGSPVLIQVGYRAMWRNTTAQAGGSTQAAIFIGSNQMRDIRLNLATAVNEASQSLAAVSAYQWLHSTTGGLVFSPAIATDVTAVTTAMALSPSGSFVGGFCNLFVPSCPASPFPVGIKFKSTHTSFTRKERHLWVRCWSLH